MPRVYEPAVGPSANKAATPGQEKKRSGSKPEEKGNESGGK